MHRPRRSLRHLLRGDDTFDRERGGRGYGEFGGGGTVVRAAADCP